MISHSHTCIHQVPVPARARTIVTEYLFPDQNLRSDHPNETNCQLSRSRVLYRDGEMYECSLCDVRSPSLSLWMSHVRLVHVSDSSVSLSCPVEGCDASYSKVNSICSHIYRKHRDITRSSSESKDTVPSGDPGVQEAASSGILMDLSLPPSLGHDVDKLLSRDANEQKKKSCLFLLQLKEERLLTQAAINDVVVGCREVFEHKVGRLKAGVSQTLAHFGVDPCDVDGLENVFDEATDPFAGLQTAYLQDKFISEELGSIVSWIIDTV